MIILCPRCQARLSLPDDSEGKQARCPNCRAVFCADEKILSEAVQTGPAPKRSEEERVTPRSPRRYEGYDDDDDDRRPDNRDHEDIDHRHFERDADVVIENAKTHCRSAGYAMLAAFIFTALNILGNAALTVMTQMELGQLPADAEVPILVFAFGCGVGFYLVPLLFMMAASRALFSLGSRGIIITAVVMNFILSFLLGGGAAINVVVLALGEMPVPLMLAMPTVIMNSISTVLNLAAAIMAIRVLRMPEVLEAYELRKAELWRHRRY